MKKRIITIITLFLLIPAIPAFTRTVVFPFKVNSSENRAHQWLGRGISLYLSYGLRLNGIDTFSDNEGRGMLKSLNIKFPYNISKASMLRAAKLMRAERLVWGEVTASPGNEEEVLSVRAFMIELKNLRQNHLPEAKGNATGLFSIQEELLTSLIGNLSGPGKKVGIPELEFDLRNYEKFIKGLLIDNLEKKTEYLETVRSGMNKAPGLLLFELGRVYFRRNDHEMSKKIIAGIDPAGPLRGERFFLSGIINYLSNNVDAALADFSEVLECGECRHEALNNISLIHALNNNYSEAKDAIKRSVRSGMRAESFFNAVNISTLLKDRESAWNFLMEGLILYPADEDLITLFFDMLEQAKYNGLIKPAFLKFLPGFPAEQEERKIFFKLINPYVFDGGKYDLEFPAGNGEAEFLRGKEEEGIYEIEKALISNPFLPENHSKLAVIFFRDGKYEPALHHGHAALYLLRNPDNYITLLKILKKQGDRDGLKEMLIDGLKFFPENEELKNFPLNSD